MMKGGGRGFTGDPYVAKLNLDSTGQQGPFLVLLTLTLCVFFYFVSTASPNAETKHLQGQLCNSNTSTCIPL